MISVTDKQKINDFKAVFRHIMNKQNDASIDKVIEAIFKNVECIYEEYKDTIEYVPVEADKYKYHILQPTNGKYSLLDFLLNRILTGIQYVSVTGDNAYMISHKILSIKPGRYEQYRGEYPDSFIEKQYLKSKLHESGHTLQTPVFGFEDAIYTYHKGSNENDGIHYFDEILATYNKYLGNKYPTVLKEESVKDVPRKIIDSKNLNNNYNIGHNLNLEEAFTEYYAVKYSDLINDDYYPTRITNEKYEGEDVPIIFVPNNFNSYSIFSKYIFHFENLTDKATMFETRFFKTNAMFINFMNKYQKYVDEFLQKTKEVKIEIPSNITNNIEKFIFLVGRACAPSAYLHEADKDYYTAVVTLQMKLDEMFHDIYMDLYTLGKIPDEKMQGIAYFSKYTSISAYNEQEGLKTTKIVEDYKKIEEETTKRLNAKKTNTNFNTK